MLPVLEMLRSHCGQTVRAERIASKGHVGRARQLPKKKQRVLMLGPRSTALKAPAEKGKKLSYLNPRRAIRPSHRYGCSRQGHRQLASVPAAANRSGS